MTDFQINDHILQKECDGLARDIFTEIMDEATDETADQMRDEMSDRVHETVDGHGWVIYYHKALMACAHCNTESGEGFLEETGMPENPTFMGLACLILFEEMRARVDAALSELIDAWEPAEAA